MSKTTCYKCETEIEVEDLTVVHPLCADCANIFDSWFQEQLAS
jgi:PHP family Zn ribbon phosphoesterase